MFVLELKIVSSFKVVAMLRRRADLTREQFIDYYETKHSRLILRLFPSITYYRRNYTDFSDAFASPDAAPFDFDVITEIGFSDRAGYDDMLVRSGNPEIRNEVSVDEQNFLDQAGTRMFVVEERATQMAAPAA